MYTTIVIDDELFRAAQKATGFKTTNAVVEAGLKLLVKMGEQKEAAKALWGAADWEGDLRQMRKDRDLPSWEDDRQT